VKGRFWFAIALAVVGSGLLLAAGYASPAEGGSSAGDRSDVRRGGALRVDLSSDFDYIDTSLAYFSHSWQLMNATNLKLFGFPDREGAAGSRMRPVGARGFPRISRDGRTYTISVRPGFRFSNGAAVTAANYRAAIARALNPRMQSPASSFLDDVASYRATGRYTLVIRLKQVAPDFLTRLTMPFFAAIPTNRPIVAEGVDAPMVSAGPYYVREWTKNQSALIVRNPFWNNARTPWRALARPAHVDRILYAIGITPAASKLRIERNETDLAGVGAAQASELAQRYGVNRGRFFVRKNMVTWYLSLNNASPLFRNNVRLRQAVNHAIDRPQMVRQHGFLGGGRTDQILPPAMPGYRDANIYSLRGANLDRARQLARGATRSGRAIFYAFNVSFGPTVAQVVQFNLRQIGLDVEIRQYDRVVQHERMATRGESFDIGHEGWGADYADPANFMNVLLDGRRIQATNNVNTAYFNNGAFNRKLEAASRLFGAARLRTYGRLDAEAMRQHAPFAPYVNTNARIFVSQNVGVFNYSNINQSTNLVATALR
jgi:ABC-type transport system substrate-binding protein